MMNLTDHEIEMMGVGVELNQQGLCLGKFLYLGDSKWMYLKA